MQSPKSDLTPWTLTLTLSTAPYLDVVISAPQYTNIIYYLGLLQDKGSASGGSSGGGVAAPSGWQHSALAAPSGRSSSHQLVWHNELSSG